MVELSGERMEPQRPTATSVLLAWQELLQESIRAAENCGWHHLPDGSVEGDHYMRLVRMEEMIDAQRARIPITATLTREAHTNALVERAKRAASGSDRGSSDS